MKILEIILERKLTKGEEKDKEKFVKGMKKNKSDFKKRYGDDAEAVMYATATKMAKESVLEDYVNKPITEEQFEKLAEKKVLRIGETVRKSNENYRSTRRNTLLEGIRKEGHENHVRKTCT